MFVCVCACVYFKCLPPPSLVKKMFLNVSALQIFPSFLLHPDTVPFWVAWQPASFYLCPVSPACHWHTLWGWVIMQSGFLPMFSEPSLLFTHSLGVGHNAAWVHRTPHVISQSKRTKSHLYHERRGRTCDTTTCEKNGIIRGKYRVFLKRKISRRGSWQGRATVKVHQLRSGVLLWNIASKME